MADAKSITDMALGTAILGAFTIPEVGAPIAAGIGVVQFFFDMFYPEAPMSGADLPLTKGDLAGALAEIKNDIEDAFWKNNTSQTISNVTKKSDEFLRFWAQLKMAQFDNDTYLFLDDTVSKTFAADCHAYFDTNNPASPFATLQAERKNITISGRGDLTAMDHAAKTLQVYGLIASLTLTYLKVAVMWQWSEYLLPYIQYDKYVTAKAKWDLDNKRSHGAVAKAHPEWAPVPVVKPANPRELWQNWTGRNTTAIVGTFLNEVKDILTYIEGTPSRSPPDGLLPVFTANWDNRAATVSAMLQQITVVFDTNISGVDYYRVTDAQNGYKSSLFGYKLAEVSLQARSGALFAYNWHQLTVNGALAGLDTGDLDKFQIMVDAWKAARQTVLYKEYAATGGETMAALAETYTTNKFTTNQLIQIIVKANPGLKSYSVLTKDQRVKLPDI